MKKFITILLLLLSINVIGKNEEFKVDKFIKIDSLKQNNIQFQSEIEKINNHIRVKDSLVYQFSQDLEKVKRENEIYKTTIETDNNIFGGLSTYFTLISILLSIIVIAIPVINYFLVLKPNRESKEKIESLEKTVLAKIEKNFETYFEDLKKNKKRKILSFLDDRSKLSQVTNYFFMGDNEELEESEVKLIIGFLKKNKDIEDVDKMILNNVVINTGYLSAEKYYKSIFEKDLKEDYKFAIDYIVNNDFNTHIPYISKLIKADKDGHNLLIDFYDRIVEDYIGNLFDNKKAPEKREKGIEYISLLLNNDSILDGIKDKPIPKTILDSHRINANRINNENPEIRDTKYYSKYLKDIDQNFY